MRQVDAFQTTLQRTGEWLRELRHRLAWDSDQRAYLALRAVLHTLRDRLPPVEAVHLGSQLPMLIRGFYYDGWRLTDTPRKLNREQFLACVAGHFRGDPDVNPADVTRAVLEIMGEHIDPGELHKMLQVLPRDFAELLPAAA
jgi:uncharacterized protein (DUF2267 family)